jgi:hypothetical protein
MDTRFSRLDLTVPKQTSLLVALLAFAALVNCQATLAQALTPPTGGPYTLTKQVIAGGGNRANGGSYELTGTVAQANAGMSAGTALQLSSGFHAPAATTNLPEAIFKNGFED